MYVCMYLFEITKSFSFAKCQSNMTCFSLSISAVQHLSSLEAHLYFWCNLSHTSNTLLFCHHGEIKINQSIYKERIVDFQKSIFFLGYNFSITECTTFSCSNNDAGFTQQCCMRHLHPSAWTLNDPRTALYWMTSLMSLPGSAGATPRLEVTAPSVPVMTVAFTFHTFSVSSFNSWYFSTF